ncbi:15690_t:CDS:1, partial [Funneliformis caledonium]
MNPISSQIQASDTENSLHSIIPTCYADNNTFTVSSQSNLEQVTESSLNENNCHITQCSFNTSTPIQTNPFGNPQFQIQPVYSKTFIYRPPNDYYQYQVNCEKISNELVLQLLNNRKENVMQLKENEYAFFYQQRGSNQFYQISCEIIPPSVINYWLNRNIHCMEIEQDMVQE